MSQEILCLDLGGSKLAWGMMADGQLRWTRQQPWQPQSADEILATLLPLAKAALAEVEQGSVAAVGITIPGPCDQEKGIWLAANFAAIGDFPIADLLSESLYLPVYADNDAKACTLAEQRYGAGRGCEDFLYLTVSNGIGGGIVAAGKLLRGAGNHAGEIGHCCIVPEGRRCACGKQGCLEAYAAGPGLSHTYQALSGQAMNGKELAQLAQSGDELALRAWALEGDYLGRGIACAVNLLNPQRVIIGGGLSLAFPHYEQALRASLDRHVFPHLRPLPQVVPTPLGYFGGLYGAAAVAAGRLAQ